MDRTKRIWAWIFVLPAVVLYTSIWVIPVLGSFALSTTNWTGIGWTMDYVGLKNYIDLVQDQVFHQSVRNTLLYVLINVPVCTIIGLGLALLLNRGLKGSAFFRTVYYLPVIIPTVAAGMVWRWIVDPNFGLMNEFLMAIGLGSLRGNWLGFERALLTIILVSIWQTFGVPMILFIAGLQNISEELMEAARIDGATEAQCLRYMTLPLLAPVTAVVVVMLIIRSFSVFDLVFVMTEGGPGHVTEFLATHLYKVAFTTFRAGYGSAIATVLFVLQFGLSFVFLTKFGGAKQ